jgi:mannose-6-phosphate isomerase
MLVKLTNKPMDYAWGSTDLIPDYFGVTRTGKPIAEIWFGTHDGSPTQVQDMDVSLQDLRVARGMPDRLPFLLKILAAEAPLSIQAHPNPAQAKAGFAAENIAGIALTDSKRNYKDDRAKPEMIVALTETFEALVGFSDSRLILERFAEISEASSSDRLNTLLSKWSKQLVEAEGLREVCLETLTSSELDEQLISDLVDAAEQCPSLVDLITHLSTHHGFDRGIVTALLMNYVVLSKGEAAFVPAGMPHAYLSGLGVEIMLASDNVLRGGLTPKHIDVEELAKVLVFEETETKTVQVKKLAVGLEEFDIPTPEFHFYRATLSPSNLLVDLNLPGDAIILCTSGAIAVSSSKGEREVINPAEAAFISGDARTFSLAGNGEAFIAISAS